MLDTAAVERILVITAHPDDVDFGAAGTIATWTARGVDVRYCVVTDGDAGGFEDELDRAEVPAIRRAEQRAAAAVLGVEHVTFLGYPDGRVVPSLALRRDLARQIRRARPDRVLTLSPERNWQRIHASHPDHRAVGDAALDAIYPDARNPYAFPELRAEGLEPHTVAEVWLMGGPRGEHHVDITAVWGRKLEALLAHPSQHPDPDGLEARLRPWFEANAAAAGLPDGSLAEVFQVLATA